MRWRGMVVVASLALAVGVVLRTVGGEQPAEPAARQRAPDRSPSLGQRAPDVSEMARLAPAPAEVLPERIGPPSGGGPADRPGNQGQARAPAPAAGTRELDRPRPFRPEPDPGPSRDPGAGADEETHAATQALLRQLRSPDREARLEAIAELATLAPEEAVPEIEALRTHEEDAEVRVAAFEQLLDLAEDEAAMLEIHLRGLADPAPEVRELAADWLASEDPEVHPQVPSALRSALAAESDPDVREVLLDALESFD